ncbi:MAG TPA: glycosyltransferase family 9 protein, partial [Blastocatellia bacterium]|nr:glycosyltransferase family 9 protein [Blastocatellia bacterium]
QGLFPELIERLNDSFNPAYCSLYDQLFVQVIEFCRRLPEGRLLDETLKQFGLADKTALLVRKAEISKPKPQIPNPKSFDSIKKVLLPSRVTIGADVAVTSVLIAKLRHALPQAEFVILGSPKLRELYGGDGRIRIREIAYERGGTLLSRLTSWVNVVETVQEELRGLREEEYWIVDPDSRLTQLGLLPLAENDGSYFFFESRSYKAASATSIGQLAAHWAGELIGDTEPAYPFLALPEEHCNFGQRVASALLNPVTISFGVGGNERKRVSAEFEEDLIAGLSAQSKLILDKGASPEEREQINRLVARLRAQGKTVVELNETNKADLIGAHLQQADVVTWDGGIGAFAGLIAGSNRYIGYDSAGQHIAAALGVPTLTVFVNSGNATFARRWRPFGRGDIEVVTVEAKQNQAPQQSVNCCGALPADDPFVLRTVETLLNQKAHRA